MQYQKFIVKQALDLSAVTSMLAKNPALSGAAIGGTLGGVAGAADAHGRGENMLTSGLGGALGGAVMGGAAGSYLGGGGGAEAAKQLTGSPAPKQLTGPRPIIMAEKMNPVRQGQRALPLPSVKYSNWHANYLTNQALMSAQLDKEAMNLFEMPGKMWGVGKDLVTKGIPSAFGAAKEVGGSVAHELGQAAKTALPAASKTPQVMSPLDVLKNQRALRDAGKALRPGGVPKPPQVM